MGFFPLIYSNKKNPLCGQSRSRNAKFYFKRDFRPDPHGGTFFTRDFFVQNFTVFRSRGLLAVPIAAFYVKKSIFRDFYQFFDGGAACRPRRDRRATYSSSANFFLNLKLLNSSLGARLAQKSRKSLKVAFCYGISLDIML
jgi:hypothetical protein